LQALQLYQVSVSSFSLKIAKYAMTPITCPWNLVGYFALILSLALHGKEISVYMHISTYTYPLISSLILVVRRETVKD